MQIDLKTLDSLLANKTQVQNYKHWIIFGADSGGVLLTKNKILLHYKKQNDQQSDQYENENYNLEYYTYKEINENLRKLQSTLATKSLFGDIMHVVITDYPDSCTKEWEKILTHSDFPGTMIIVADELKKTNKLRKTCEGLDHIALVNCYKPGITETAIKITKELQKMNIEFEQEVPYFIATKLPQDSLIIEGELEKISLYFANIGKSYKLTTKEIAKIIIDESDLMLETMAFGFVTGNKKLLISEFQKVVTQNTNLIFISRAFQNYLNRVLELKTEIAMTGKSIYQAINMAKPPMFGKMKDDVQYILQNVSIGKLRKLMFTVLQMEIMLKSSNIYNDNNAILQLLMQ